MQEHQEMLEQGYEVSGGRVDPESNNTGDFRVEYSNQLGEQATLSGRMEQGDMKELSKDTPQLRQEMLSMVRNDTRFQEYETELKKQGFSEQEIQYQREEDKTTMQFNYMDENNQSALISAEILNKTVEKVELESENNEERMYWWLLWVVLGCAAGYVVYRRIRKSSQKSMLEPETKKHEPPFDHVKESKMLLQRAQKLFEEKKYKDAYGTAAQGLRLYLRYENGLEAELTNDDVVGFLRRHRKPYMQVKKCFDLCSLVEFARYEANKQDFARIIRYAQKVIGD
jgi:hypothetical protein